MKRITRILVPILCFTLAICAFAACGNKKNKIPEPKDGEVRVLFKDGENVLSYQIFEKGGKAEKPETPTKEGFEFVRWYATPSYNIAFDFDAPVEESINVYAGFRSTAADDHTWYIVGESVSDLFKEVGWTAQTDASAIPDKNLMKVDATQKNLFTITADFYVGDKFQILNTADGWSGQIGYGYMNVDQYSADNSSDMFLSASLSDDTKKANIAVGKSGNYTVKLYVDTAGVLTEIAFVRNGDAAPLPVDYNYYIKGAKVTGWANMLVDYTMFATEDKANYTLTIGLQDGDQFMFLATQIGDTTEKTHNFNTENVVLADDNDTKAAFETKTKTDGSMQSNFYVKGGTGTYELKLAEPASDGKVTLSAKKTSEEVPAYDFYLKGSIGGDTDWANRTKLTYNDTTKMYELKDVSIAKDDEFQITVTKAGVAPATGMDKDALLITAEYANGGAMSNQIDTSKTNFKKTTDGTDTFTISVDPVSMRVSVEGTKDIVTYAVNIHGAFNGGTDSWADGATEEVTQKADGSALTVTITKALKANDQFGFSVYKKNDNVTKSSQICWVSSDKLTACDGLDATSGNVKCTADGTYTFTINLGNDGKISSITAAKA